MKLANLITKLKHIEYEHFCALKAQGALAQGQAPEELEVLLPGLEDIRIVELSYNLVILESEDGKAD